MGIRVLLMCAAGLVLGGCESTRNDVAAGFREKFSGPTYRAQVFSGERRPVFEAARDAAEGLGFRVTRASEAQGRIEGLSGIVSDDRLVGSRQRTIKVRLEPVVGGGVEVGVLFTEIVEDDFITGAGQGSEVSLRESPLYAAFFNRVTSALVR